MKKFIVAAAVASFVTLGTANVFMGKSGDPTTIKFSGNEAYAESGVGIDINNDVCVCKNSTCKQAAIIYTNPQCGTGYSQAQCNSMNYKCQ